MMNIAHTLLRSAIRWPQMPGVIEGERIKLSYAQLAQRCLKLAGALRGPLNIAPGKRVGIVMRNCTQYVELMYACWIAGICAIPINVKLHAREVAFILDDAQASLCFITTGDVDTTLIDADRVNGSTTFIDVDTRHYDRLLQAAPDLFPTLGSIAEIEPDALAWLFYTSGTTGRPKGAMLSHRVLLAMTVNYLANTDHAQPGEQLLHVAPMSHGSGACMVTNITAGCTQLVPASRGFDVAEIDGLLTTKTRVKFYAAPTMVMRLVDGIRGDARGLKQIVYSGGPMYVADAQRALARLGPKLVQNYGLGEVPLSVAVLSAADHMDNGDGRQLARLGSAGRAQPGMEVAAFDEDGHRLPAGQVGEIRVRGDAVMLGYLNNPAASAEALALGWFHTGDLGRFDEYDYLTLVDRSKDMLVSGGSAIYSREIEEVLLQHAGVREVAVIGEPDPEWGEAVVAFVVPRSEQPLDVISLDTTCLAHLARYKRPQRYVFVHELPKTSSGKVLKRELRTMLANGATTVPVGDIGRNIFLNDLTRR